MMIATCAILVCFRVAALDSHTGVTVPVMGFLPRMNVAVL